MLQSSIAKQRRRASLVVLGWLLMTVFSCTALSNTSPAMDMPDQAHHAMAGMTDADHETMPCCEPLLDQLCCDDVAATHSSYANSIESAEQLSLAALPVSTPAYSLPQFNACAIVQADSQHQLASYPRLHLVHCTFLD